MARHLDSVPLSGIIRIRDLMFTVENPFRLDQGDVSFDAPDTVKDAMARAIAENRSHYVQTTGVPRLLQLLVDKLRRKNGIPVESTDEVMVANGGIHALFLICQAVLEPGDEMLVPDPEWPPAAATVTAAHGVPVGYRLYETRGWRPDLDELERLVTPRTRVIYLNSPQNPTGGVLSRTDLERIAAMTRERNLWVVSDEAYEDVVFDGAGHVSIASLPGMHERTISLFTFSKSYAMTGLRLGYAAVKDRTLADRMKKLLFYTASNISTVVQHGGIGALEGSGEPIERFRRELQARRDLFYQAIGDASGGVFSGSPPAGAFYAFVRIDPRWRPGARSISWEMAEHLITQGRIGCVPGVDFGPHGEGYIRFCFARERHELTGALGALHALFARAGSGIQEPGFRGA